MEKIKELVSNELAELNFRYGVIDSVDRLKGWHLAGCDFYKRGVYRIAISKYSKIAGDLFSKMDSRINRS